MKWTRTRFAFFASDILGDFTDVRPGFAEQLIEGSVAEFGNRLGSMARR
jgi:hypothetical protein